AAVEGVVTGDERAGVDARRAGAHVTDVAVAGRAGLDVDRRLALGEVLGVVHIEVVAPQDVLVARHARPIRRSAREVQGALSRGVDRDVATRDRVTEVEAAAVATVHGRSVTGVQVADVRQQRRVDRRVGVRQTRRARREVDVLRQRALRADGVLRILARGGRDRQVALEDVADADRLYVVARQVDVE